jgi:hypothetical protein
MTHQCSDINMTRSILWIGVPHIFQISVHRLAGSPPVMTGTAQSAFELLFECLPRRALCQDLAVVLPPDESPSTRLRLTHPPCDERAEQSVDTRAGSSGSQCGHCAHQSDWETVGLARCGASCRGTWGRQTRTPSTYRVRRHGALSATHDTSGDVPARATGFHRAISMLTSLSRARSHSRLRVAVRMVLPDRLRHIRSGARFAHPRAHLQPDLRVSFSSRAQCHATSVGVPEAVRPERGTAVPRACEAGAGAECAAAVVGEHAAIVRADV